MDTGDKILKFDTLESLKQAISDDRDSRDMLARRYCVRFIMLNNFGDYKELYKWLCSENDVENINIEELAEGPDLGISSDCLRNAILECKETSIFTPFSELVRFYPEDKFRGFFNDIILTENKPGLNIRIYLPIIGLHNRFTDFLKNFGRIQESAPIWQFYSSNDQVHVYVTDIQMRELPNVIDAKSISTMGEWLRFWKTLAPVEKIICSARFIRTRYMHSKPDSIFSFHRIENAHSYLTEFMGLHIPIVYSPEDGTHWNNLAKAIIFDMRESFHFTKFVADYFKVANVDRHVLIQKWTDNGSSVFDRWLLHKLSISSDILFDSPYLKICVNETSQISEPYGLLNIVASRIFHMFTQTEASRYANERAEIISEFADLFRTKVSFQTQKELKDEMIAIVQNGNEFGNIKKYCTGVFDFEKSLYIAWYALRSENDFGINDLKKLYPSLASYIDTEEDLTESPAAELKEYMQEYRLAKIKDKRTAKLTEMLARVNENKETFYSWYYSIPDEHELLAAESVDYVYWADGLGVEFMPLILALIKKSNFSITRACYARTGLPSETNLNRFDVDNERRFKIENLDYLAHNGSYRKFETLAQEIYEVENIIKRIIGPGERPYCSIAIVSDHGLSAMSRLAPSIKLSKEVKHEGRYIPLKGSDHDDDKDYIVCRNENDGKYYRVALGHSSLGRKPMHEVHGGATPEEVLVPFIVISNKPIDQKKSYVIKIVSSQIAISEPILQIDIMPTPPSAKVLINDKSYDMEKRVKWELKVDFLSEGAHSVTVIPDGGEPKRMNFNVYGLGGDTSNPFDDF